MREIRFRGKRIDIGRWVEGSYLKMFHGLHMDGNHYIHFIVDTKGIRYEVYPETIGQFTGLKDRIGREIYEGDVVKVGMNGAITEVTFEAGSFLTIVGESRYRLGGWETEAVEVLGNRFDHPHLLKGDGNDA